MKIIFWIAYVLTVAEFLASPINVLRGSDMHLKRFREVRFPLGLARALAVIELVAVVAVIFGIHFVPARKIGGIVLAIAFSVLLPWALLRSKRPAENLLGLGLFIAGAFVVVLY